ncbi:phage tail tape measure protein [Shewanella sp. MEBiC00475]|uniref:phage tail tape measure protein n=1 Tax=Shewanella sp. MEBiC00475 TaxID=2575361 RepID=UPI0010C15108|nr:phage tail tape measure protein [Shewanella sp. MEBiC00475]
MSFKDQVINLIIQGKDLFSSEAKKSEKALAELAAQSEKLNAELDDLKRQEAAVNAIDGLTASIRKGEKAYVDNAVALDNLKKEQKQVAAEAKQLDAAQVAAANSTARIETEYNQAVAELAKYDNQLKLASAEVDKLTATQNKGAQASQSQALALAKAKDDLQKLDAAQKSTATSATRLATELEQETAELKKISSEVDKAGQKKGEYALKVKSASSELTKLGSSLSRNKTELDKQQTVLNKAGIDMGKLADASKDLKTKQAAAEQALKGVNDKLGQHDKLLSSSQKSAGAANKQTLITTKAINALAKAYAVLLSAQTAIQSVRSSVEGYGELESAITKVEKTTGNAREAVVKMASELKDLGENVTPTSTNELLRMAEVAGQLGTKSTEDILNLVAAADALGLSTNLAGDEAATMLARILGMTQEGIPQIQNLSSSVVALGNDFAVTEADIVSMTKEIVTGTREINLGSAASAAFGATLAELGQPAERSRTAIQKLGAAINEASKKGGDDLELLTKITGQTADQIEKDLGDAPEKVLVKFLEGLKRVKSEGGLVSDALKSMGIEGVEATSVLSVLADGTDRLKTALELSNKAYIAGDYHMKEAAKAYADQSAAIGRLENKFHTLTTSIGEAFSDEVDTAIRATSDAIDAVDENVIQLMERIPELANGFVDLLADINNFAAGTDESFSSLEYTMDAFAAGLNTISIGVNSLALELSDMNVATLEALRSASKLSGVEFVTAKQVTDAKDRSAKIREAIKRDSDDIIAYNKRMNGESSIAYEGLIKTTTKYKDSLKQLSIEQRNQINDILLSGTYNKDLETTYRELTAALVRANRETEIEAQLKAKAAEASKKKAEEDKKAADAVAEHADNLAKLNTNTLTYSEALIDVKERQKSLNELYAKGVISAEGLAKASQLLKDSLKGYSTEVDASNASTATQTELTDQFIAKRKELQAQYEQGLLTEKELTISQQELASAYDKTVNEVNLATAGIGLLSDEQLGLQESIISTEAEIRALEQALKDENKATNELILIKAKLAKEEANLADIKRESVELSKIENATYVELLVLQREYETQLEILDRNFRAGLLTKQEYDAQSKTLEKTLSDLNDVVGESSRKKAENAEKTKEATAAVKDNTEANKENSQSLEDQTGQYISLSDATVAYRSVILDTGQSYIDTAASADELISRIEQMGILQSAYLAGEEKRRYSELQTSLSIRRQIDDIDSSTYSLEALDKMASKAASGIWGLSDVQLQPLTNAIDSARAKLQDLADDINATTLDIQDRLDTALGNEKDIIKRKFASEVKEIDDLITKAQAYGNSQLVSTLQKSLSDLKRAQSLELKAQQDASEKQAISDAATAKQQTTAASSVQTNVTTQTQPSTTTTAAATSSDTVVLQLQVGNSTFDAQAKRSIVNELVAEIKRLQSVGG